MPGTISNLLSPLLDMADIAHHARNKKEIVRAFLPAKWVRPRILNEGSVTKSENSASDSAKMLRQTCNALREHAVNEQGRVEYAKLRQSDLFVRLQEQSLALENTRPDLLSDSERMAFWLNVYNVLSIHGVIALDVRKSVMEFPSFFRMVAYRIAHESLTPDDIENGVLRLNAPHPATHTRMFKAGDRRLAFCPLRLDPRIHAALVCASKSCPPVAFYDPERVDEQLTLAARNYVETNVSVDAQSRALLLPIAFRYFRNDFGGWPGIQDFILQHAGEPLKDQIRNAFHQNYRCVFQRYDWSLNDVIL